MAILYMSQNIVTTFAQAMINNALYLKPNKDKSFSKILSAGFFISIIISILIALAFFVGKDYLILLFKKIDTESKSYAIKYITFMIPFFILFNMEQYLTYTLYSLKLAKINFLYIVLILVINTLFNYIAVFKLGLSTEGIALSSALSLLITLPLYFWISFRKGIKIGIIFNKIYYQKAFIGVKNLGIAAIIGPLWHQFIQFFIAILIAQIAQEMLSAKYHARNFLSYVLALSLAFGAIIQIHIAQLYGEGKLLEVKNFYKKYLRYATLSIFIAVVISTVFILYTVENYSTNLNVQKYIILIMLMGFLVEPARVLSITSKAHLHGLQIANIPLILALLNKIIISLPLFYIVVNFTHLGLFGIISVEGIGYLVNFTIYSFLIRRFYNHLTYTNNKGSTFKKK